MSGLRRLSPKSASEWGSALLVWFAMLGLVACFLVWVLTGRVEALFVTTFGGLLGVGYGSRALVTLREPPLPPIPPADPPEESP
jgi:hypothetical protein